MSDAVPDGMVETLAAELFRHRLVVDDAGKSVCKCGWWISPLLDSVHRVHQAEALGVVALRYAYQDATARTHAVGLLLASSGDITAMGTRMLDRIWEPAVQNN
jgi:hypothetical protein